MIGVPYNPDVTIFLLSQSLNANQFNPNVPDTDTGNKTTHNLLFDTASQTLIWVDTKTNLIVQETSAGSGGTIGGGGTLNYIAKYTPDGLNIGNSLLYDNGTSVGLGTNTPNASAIFELSSSTQGFVTPRMTTLQRDAIATPMTGLLIYNTSSSFFNYWDGSTWIQMDTSTGGDVSGSGTTNYATMWSDGPNSVIGDGTWYFSGNDYLPVTTGSNIGDATHRIGTIFMASIFDYANDLTFYNGTSTTATLTTSGLFGIGKNPTAKLDVLQDTVGTGAKGLSVNFNTIGEVFYIDDNGAAMYNANAGFTMKGSNGILNIISNGGVSPSISFKYNNGALDSGLLYGVGASMFLQTPLFGIGSINFTPSAQLHVSGLTNSGEKLLKLTTTSGLWDILDVGQGTITSRVNTFRMYGSGVPGTSANPTLILHDEVGGNPQLAMYSDLYTSNTLIIDGLGIPRFTATYSNRMWFNSNVGVGLIATLDTRLYVQGSDATSFNYAFKSENVSLTPILYARNDGEVGMNGFTIRQLSSYTIFKTSGTNGYLFNNAADNANLARLTNSGVLIVNAVATLNSNVGLSVKAQGVSDATKEYITELYKGSTNNTGITVASKEGVSYIQGSTSANGQKVDLILGAYDGAGQELENLVLKNNGGINASTLQVGNAGLSSGDLYVDTAANILANADLIVGRKV